MGITSISMCLIDSSPWYNYFFAACRKLTLESWWCLFDCKKTKPLQRCQLQNWASSHAVSCLLSCCIPLSPYRDTCQNCIWKHGELNFVSLNSLILFHAISFQHFNHYYNTYLWPNSCAIVCAKVMPLSSFTLQLLSGWHIPPTWATPRVPHGESCRAQMSSLPKT